MFVRGIRIYCFMFIKNIYKLDINVCIKMVNILWVGLNLIMLFEIVKNKLVLIRNFKMK